MVSLQSILDFEMQHLDANIRSSPERLGALLCDDFCEFGASGKTWDKAEILASVTSEAGDTVFQVENYHIQQLGENHVLATYTLSAHSENRVRLTLRSTIWKLVDDKWCILFHQGTQKAA